MNDRPNSGGFRGAKEANAKNFFDVLREARIESIKRQIEADAIILSPNIALSVIRSVDGCCHPMICGMKVSISNELPAMFDFALVKSNEEDELEQLRAENKRLREKMFSIINFIREV